MIGSNFLTCFKAYDIRGKLGEEIDEDVAIELAGLLQLLKLKS